MTTMGLALLKKGDRHKALESLQESMEDNFEGLASASNVDMKLVEALLRKKVGLPECRVYIEKALEFAKSTKEEKYVDLFSRLLDAFPEEENSNY